MYITINNSIIQTQMPCNRIKTQTVSFLKQRYLYFKVSFFDKTFLSLRLEL